MTLPGTITFNREFCMPSPWTFSMKPVRELLNKWLDNRSVVIDPFSGNSAFGTVTNDLNPASPAQFHLLAEEFLDKLIEDGVQADAVLFDPPYSPRQISEVYKSVGLKVGAAETQNARLYKIVRDRLNKLLKPDGIAISFGWNSGGFGITRGYFLHHGGAHNDTICVVETKGAIVTDNVFLSSGEQPCL